MSERKRIEREALAIFHRAYEVGGRSDEDMASSFVSLVMREREAVWKKAIEIAESAHPQDGECCFEDPDGHSGGVSTADAIAEALSAFAELDDNRDGIQKHTPIEIPREDE